MFDEVQKFRQRWLWLLLIIISILSIAIFAHGMIEQFVFGRPWGDRPVSDMSLLVTSVTVIIFILFMLYLFYTLRLITHVDAKGIYIRFYPFPGKIIDFPQVESCEARTYRPLSEYGGWGIKYGRSGKAYNISGDRGAQLVMKDGKRVLIGSQHADELSRTINYYL
jgi:hypothetical protein